jgi:hypothetical protein
MTTYVLAHHELATLEASVSDVNTEYNYIKVKATFSM